MTIDRAEYGNHEGYGLKPAKENMAFSADAQLLIVRSVQSVTSIIETAASMSPNWKDRCLK